MNKESKLKDQMVDRVREVLNNAHNIDDICITIRAARGEAAEIRYNIAEFIIPEEVD